MYNNSLHKNNKNLRRRYNNSQCVQLEGGLQRCEASQVACVNSLTELVQSEPNNTPLNGYIWLMWTVP